MLTPASTDVCVTNIKPNAAKLAVPQFDVTATDSWCGRSSYWPTETRLDVLFHSLGWLAGTPDTRLCEHKQMFFIIVVGLPYFHMNTGFGDVFNWTLVAGRLLASAAGAFQTVWIQVRPDQFRFWSLSGDSVSFGQCAAGCCLQRRTLFWPLIGVITDEGGCHSSAIQLVFIPQWLLATVPVDPSELSCWGIPFMRLYFRLKPRP